MARGKKTDEPKVLPAADKAKPAEVRQVISQSKLISLMKAKRSAKKETGEINGRVGGLIADAVENNHLNRKAFGWIAQLDQMEPEKIADLLDSFEYYLDVSGVAKRRESVMRMNLKDADSEAEAEASNVSKFPAPAGTA